MGKSVLGQEENFMNFLGANRCPFLFILDFEMEKPLVLPLQNIDSNDIRYQLNEQQNYINPQYPLSPLLHFEKKPIDVDVYKNAFDHVLKEINYGNSYLVNLTFPTAITTNLSLKDIFYKSQAKYKLWFKDEFVVFSPEIFVQIKNGLLSSYPMKGTINADIPNAAGILMQNFKEIAEHHTIVDLIRNDLNLVATKTHVERFRYIDQISTNSKDLLQVSSKIVGTLNTNYHRNIGTILYKLLPAGSVSGAPKKKTLEIIRASELDKRGYYTGIMGIFDGTNLDSGVMIRYIEQTKNGLQFRSGGGITTHSDADAEYQELIDKVYVPIARNHTNRKRNRSKYMRS